MIKLHADTLKKRSPETTRYSQEENIALFSLYPCLLPIVMSVNSSPSFNASLPASSTCCSSLYFFLYKCFRSKDGAINITILTIISILVLFPLYILVLYLGFKRWRQQRSNSTTSHSDVFTYNMVFMELMSVFGSTLICCGVYTVLQQMMMVGIYLFTINLSGQMFFHLLTCVERYLAVVHPITYLSLRQERGIRIRNITVVCAWLLSFALTGLLSAENQVLIDVIFYSTMAFVLILISLCSLSVLCVLIRPGPGEGGGGREQADQSKLKAFYTIMVILGVLMLRFGGTIVISALYDLMKQAGAKWCGLWLSTLWFCLPSSLVLPLLFLQRARKLLCCKNHICCLHA